MRNVPQKHKRIMKIHIIRELSEAVRFQIDALLHTLSRNAPELSTERLQTVLQDESFTLFAAEGENGVISGMLTLTYCNTLSGRKYWIEDVVVDEAFRGKGAGRALVRAAVDYVKKKEELPVIYLTSNPSRISARSLYVSEGFKEYETGVFRIK